MVFFYFIIKYTNTEVKWTEIGEMYKSIDLLFDFRSSLSQYQEQIFRKKQLQKAAKQDNTALCVVLATVSDNRPQKQLLLSTEIYYAVCLLPLQ